MLVIQIKPPIEDNKKILTKEFFFFFLLKAKRLTKNKEYRAQALGGDAPAFVLGGLCQVAEETPESLRGLKMPSNWGSNTWSWRSIRGWDVMKPTHVRLGP